jgi:hypothetical protein
MSPLPVSGIRQLVTIAAAFLFAVASPIAAFAEPVPQWLSAADKEPLGALADKADAVTLVDYENTVVSRDGLFVSEYRKAVKILTENGSADAVGRIEFNRNTDTFENVHAWLILPNGKLRDYGARSFVDIENKSIDIIFTENWARVIDLSPSAVPGSIFAYSYRIKQRSPFPQTSWRFQSGTPVLKSTLRLTIPDDWTLTIIPVNKPRYTENKTGTTYLWEAVRLPAIKDESMCVVGARREYLGISIHPSETDKEKCGMATIDDWQSVAAFQASFNDPSATADDAIRAKVAELTRGCNSQWERIRALCRYAQSVSYVSVNTGLDKGNGYRPNPAPTVFSRNSGDCKDKTALLRAMLSCIGVNTFSIPCLCDDTDAVHPEWPSPYQFNHCITAMTVPDDLNMPACVVDPKLGRMMLFDPTCTYTPPGYIPCLLQGTYYLVGSKDCSGLAKFPYYKSSDVEELTAGIDSNGKLAGTLSSIATGSSAENGRSVLETFSGRDVVQGLTELLRTETRKTKILNWSTKADDDADRLKLDIEFDAPDYARHIGRNMLLFKAFTGSIWGGIPGCKESERKTPVQLQHYEFERDSAITLPEGFVVDELPQDITFEETFGTVTLRSAVEGNTVKVRMEAKSFRKVIPAEDYEKFRTFYKTINKALLATVVIRRA